jgi:hypothetical protein
LSKLVNRGIDNANVRMLNTKAEAFMAVSLFLLSSMIAMPPMIGRNINVLSIG